jgi:predicted acylesterase/phospholipase RssA
VPTIRVKMSTLTQYDAVVFAGGGCRCAWQVGFWDTAAPSLQLRPVRIGAVSAGAAMAVTLFAGVARETMTAFKERVARNERNAYPANLLSNAPVFPHERIYRETLLEHLDAAAVERLHRGPEIRVLMARAPWWLGPWSGVAAALIAYEIEQLLPTRVHPFLGRRIGFAPEVASTHDCRTPQEVVDLVLHSSCTPPFTPAYSRDGRPVLDGGLIDGVPVEAVASASASTSDEGSTLVLLTKHYPQEIIPQVAGRTYVGPSEPIGVHKWDYTSPEGVQAAFDLGRRDGERFAETHGALAA